jgi:hypothetical protein
MYKFYLKQFWFYVGLYFIEGNKGKIEAVPVLKYHAMKAYGGVAIKFNAFWALPVSSLR